MDPLREPLRNERGIGLIVALLVLLVLSLLAAVLMMSINTNTKIAGHSMRESQALNTAEAGIAEALSQVRAQSIMASTTNPRAVGQIYSVAAGSVPVPGNADSTFVATAQPAGSWLDYSRPSRGPDVLTVTYLTDPGKTVIYRYDKTLTNPVQTVSGLPIMVITSVGRKGSDTRKIVAQVIVKPIVANIKAALAANIDINFVGNAVVCGYNHMYSTPAWTGDNGRGVAPDCATYETGAGNMPSSWTTSTSNPGGGGSQTFSPVIPPNQTNQVGFYAGPWEALGMTQAEFFSWIGPAKASWLPNGIGYYAADLGIHGGNGEGMTYVGGDLTINAGFTYKGLLYVEGNLIMNGQAWVLGGIIVKGTTSVKQNGGSTLLYSSDAITQALSRYGATFTTLSWLETRL